MAIHDAVGDREARFSERRLIQMALDGDEAAYFTLFAVYRPRVTATVSLWERDPDARDDVVQMTFIKAFRSLRAFRGDSAFGTWVTRIAINTCLSARRADRARRNWMTLLQDIESGKAALTAAAQSPDEVVLQRERRELVAERLGRLPERYRQALRLHYIGGRSYNELTKELSVPMGTLKTWMNRARRQLAGEMDAEAAVQAELRTPGGEERATNGKGGA